MYLFKHGIKLFFFPVKAREPSGWPTFVAQEVIYRILRHYTYRKSRQWDQSCAQNVKQTISMGQRTILHMQQLRIRSGRKRW